MTQSPSPEDLQQILESVVVAEATQQAAIKEIFELRQRMRRAEASLALVLGAMADLDGEGADYTMHRLSMELRRLAQLPERAAELAGCEDVDVDPNLLQAIASHLSDMREQPAWPVGAQACAVMH